MRASVQTRLTQQGWYDEIARATDPPTTLLDEAEVTAVKEANRQRVVGQSTRSSLRDDVHGPPMRSPA